jgi:hypothetical protein
MRAALLLMLAAACGGSRTEAAPAVDHAPSIELTPVGEKDLCITKGELAGKSIEVPTMRGFALGAGGDAAQVTFTYRGESFETRQLAGGQERRQIGLKLRAKDSCNVVYVMWRLDPVPKLDISVKLNPGMRAHEQCGANGYTKIKPYKKTFVPAFEFGATHTLRAEIAGDELFAWIDGKLLWQGRLPDAARSINGPAGIRSDNVRFDLVELAAPHSAAAPPACKRDGSD